MAVSAKNNGYSAVFAHGCNCHVAMASGIAGEFVRAFPDLVETDKEYNFKYYAFMLGRYSEHKEGTVTILNLYTQFNPGRDCRYDAIRSAFAMVEKSGFRNVIIPRIGAGIAGGDWNVIEAIINSECPTTNITVVDWDGTQFDEEVL